MSTSDKVPELKVTKTKDTDTSLIELPTQTKILDPEDEPFKPTHRQRKIKTVYYTKVRHLKLNPEDVTVDHVYKYTGEDKIYSWWKVVDFKNWFRDSDEYHNKVNYLLALQLDNLEEVIVDYKDVYDMRHKLMAGKQLMEFKKAMDEAESKSKELSDEDKREIARRIFEERLKSGTSEGQDKIAPKKTKVDLPI